MNEHLAALWLWSVVTSGVCHLHTSCNWRARTRQVHKKSLIWQNWPWKLRHQLLCKQMLWDRPRWKEMHQQTWTSLASISWLFAGTSPSSTETASSCCGEGGAGAEELVELMERLVVDWHVWLFHTLVMKWWAQLANSSTLEYLSRTQTIFVSFNWSAMQLMMRQSRNSNHLELVLRLVILLTVRVNYFSANSTRVWHMPAGFDPLSDSPWHELGRCRPWKLLGWPHWGHGDVEEAFPFGVDPFVFGTRQAECGQTLVLRTPFGILDWQRTGYVISHYSTPRWLIDRNRCCLVWTLGFKFSTLRWRTFNLCPSGGWGKLAQGRHLVRFN